MAESQNHSFARRLALLLLEWRFISLAGVAFTSFSFVVGIVRSFGLLDIYIPRDFVNSFFVAGILGLVLAFFIYVAERLNLIPQGYAGQAIDRRDLDALYSLLIKRLDRIEQNALEFSKSNEKIDANAISAALPAIEKIAKERFTEASLIEVVEQVKAQYGQSIDIAFKLEAIKSVYQEAVNEVNSQLMRQRVNSNLNLYIGLIFAAGGIAFLGYVYFTVYAGGIKSTDTYEIKTFILGFLPRMTFVVLVESVAFFFLSLYREDRSMIRYFRNEITNFESKFIALETAARFSDNKSLSKVIDIFAHTERNFTMRKGEKLVVEALREEDDKMFARLVDKLSNNFDLSKIRRGNDA